MNQIYAICSCVFVVALSAVLTIYGDQPVREAVVVALFFAALSQFFAQSEHRPVIVTANWLATFSLISMVTATLLFVTL